MLIAALDGSDIRRVEEITNYGAVVGVHHANCGYGNESVVVSEGVHYLQNNVK